MAVESIYQELRFTTGAGQTSYSVLSIQYKSLDDFVVTKASDKSVVSATITSTNNGIKIDGLVASTNYVLVRNTPVVQGLKLAGQNKYDPDDVEGALDDLTLQNQEQKDILGRAVAIIDTFKALVVGLPLKNVADPKTIEAIYRAIEGAEDRVNTKSATVDSAYIEIQNIKAAIVAITGKDTDPSTVHNVYSLENLVKLMKTYVYGQAHTWDWDSSGVNQYYRDLSNDPLYPKINNLQPVFKAYVLDRYKAGDTIFANTVITNPVLLRELQLTVGKTDKDGKNIGAKLVFVTQKFVDDIDADSVFNKSIYQQNIGKYMLVESYTCVGNEVKPDGNYEKLVKLFTFNPPTTSDNGKYQTAESDNTSKFKVWGVDDGATGFKMSFDGSDLQDADGTVESTAPRGYTIVGKTPIITFELDFLGAKDYNFLTGKSADEAEASVHGRYIEFNIGIDGDGNPAFTDGHFTVQQSKDLGLTALAKGTKYTFNVKDIPLISHWLPEHLIPSDGKNFFQTVILKTADITVNDRYIQQDFDDKKIPDNRKVDDVKLEAKSKASDGAILDISSFPIVDFTPEFNGIHTITFEELSVKWFQGKIQELKDLSEKYAVGFKFPEFSRALTLTNNSPTAHTITFLTEDPNAGGDYILIPEEYRSLLVKDNFGKLFNITATFEGVPITVGLEPPPALDLDLVENDTPISTGNYTATVAGTIKIQVEFFGAKQYRDRISGKVETVVQNQLGATKDLLDKAVTDAKASETNAGASAAASATAQGLSESARDASVSAKDDAEGFKTDAETAAITAQNASLTSGYSDNKHLTTADLVVPPKAAAGEFEYVIPPTNRVHYFVDTSDVRQDRGNTGPLAWFIMDLPISDVAASIKAGETKSGVFEIMITKKNDGAIPIMIYPEGQNAKIEDVPRKSANFVAPYRIDKAGAYVFTLQRTVNADGTLAMLSSYSGHRDGRYDQSRRLKILMFI